MHSRRLFYSFAYLELTGFCLLIFLLFSKLSFNLPFFSFLFCFLCFLNSLPSPQLWSFPTYFCTIYSIALLHDDDSVQKFNLSVLYLRELVQWVFAPWLEAEIRLAHISQDEKMMSRLDGSETGMRQSLSLCTSLFDFFEVDGDKKSRAYPGGSEGDDIVLSKGWAGAIHVLSAIRRQKSFWLISEESVLYPKDFKVVGNKKPAPAKVMSHTSTFNLKLYFYVLMFRQDCMRKTCC